MSRRFIHTEAGKRLLDGHEDAAVYCGLLRHVMRASIENIEAEAVAAERARIVEGVRGLADGFADVYAFAVAVLAIIEEKPSSKKSTNR